MRKILKKMDQRPELNFAKAEHSRRTQEIINNLLMISMKNHPLNRILELVIDQITSIEWLVLQSKGAIFLINDHTQELELKACKAFSSHAINTCSRVPIGYCLCGRAASSGKVIFADCIDERHDILYPDIMPHGHFCVPIISEEGIISGVITLYLKEGHTRVESEETFLKTVARTLAGIIEYKLIEKSLIEKQKELERKNRDIEEANIALTVLLNKRQDDKKEFENRIAYNLKTLVEPHLEQLKATKLTPRQKSHLDLLETNLFKLTSSFAQSLSQIFEKLTPMELQVAAMIKNGQSTKEIAQVFVVSDQTISVHRRNIRKKLKLNKMKTNLRTYLLSIRE